MCVCAFIRVSSACPALLHSENDVKTGPAQKQHAGPQDNRSNMYKMTLREFPDQNNMRKNDAKNGMTPKLVPNCQRGGVRLTTTSKSSAEQK